MSIDRRQEADQAAGRPSTPMQPTGDGRTEPGQRHRTEPPEDHAEQSAHPPDRLPAQEPGEAERRRRRTQRYVAIVLLVLIGMRRDLVGSVAIADAVALMAAPMTWSAVRRLRRFSPLLLLGTLAAATSLVLAWTVGPTFHVSPSLQRSMVMSLLALPWTVAAFVWGARRLGARGAALCVGWGMLLEALRLLQSSENPWKLGVGLAVSMIALSWASNRGRRLQLLVLVMLSASFLVTDARSSLAYLVILMGIILWQACAAWFRWSPPRPRRLATAQALVLGAIGVAATIGVLAVSASGSLGADAQARTIAQSDGSSSFLLNARPELGASWALVYHRPWGYGAGVMPRFTDVQVAKDGMAALGYDPSNGYVENFMFGHGFELHSALVDVWVAASLPGAALMGLITVLTLLTMLRDLGSLRVTPWLFLAGLVTLQNMLVGPWNVLPPYLVFILGTWMLYPSLRTQNHRAAEPAGQGESAAGAGREPQTTHRELRAAHQA